ncbi:MAG: tetratricopeptide repeat protein, partial [Solirubrobacteraceae bacterium]
MNRKQRRTEKKSSGHYARGEKLYAEGLKAFQAGQPLLAAERLEQAIRAGPASPVFHMHLGLAQSAVGRAREAEASFRQALELQPDYFEAKANLANLLWVQGRVDEAEAGYTAILTF